MLLTAPLLIKIPRNKCEYCTERKPDLKEGVPPSGEEKDGAGKEGKVGPKSGAHDPNIR